MAKDEKAQAAVQARIQARLVARGQRLAKTRDDDEARAEVELLTLSVGPQLYAVRTTHVDSVSQLGALTPVPGAPAWALGLVRLRGAYLTLLDLRELLQPGATGLADATAVVVVRAGSRRVALAASELHDVVLLAQRDVDNARPSADGITRPVVAGELSLALVDAPALLADGRLGAEAAASPFETA